MPLIGVYSIDTLAQVCKEKCKKAFAIATFAPAKD